MLTIAVLVADKLTEHSICLAAASSATEEDFKDRASE
jgi:hypothetical protein